MAENKSGIETSKKYNLRKADKPGTSKTMNHGSKRHFKRRGLRSLASRVF
jgi:hypothetical protein